MATIEWKCRWSGGMKETTLKVHPAKQEIVPQREFARHVRHIPGGSELYRADVENEIVLFLYISGSGKTEQVKMIHGPDAWKTPFYPTWNSFDECEHDLGFGEGALRKAFWE